VLPNNALIFKVVVYDWYILLQVYSRCMVLVNVKKEIILLFLICVYSQKTCSNISKTCPCRLNSSNEIGECNY